MIPSIQVSWTSGLSGRGTANWLDWLYIQYRLLKKWDKKRVACAIRRNKIKIIQKNGKKDILTDSWKIKTDMKLLLDGKKNHWIVVDFAIILGRNPTRTTLPEQEMSKIISKSNNSMNQNWSFSGWSVHWMRQNIKETKRNGKMTLAVI